MEEQQRKQINTEALTAARYGAEVPSFGWTGGEAPWTRVSIGVPAEILFKILIWKTGESINTMLKVRIK